MTANTTPLKTIGAVVNRLHNAGGDCAKEAAKLTACVNALRERVALLEGALRYCIERGHSPDVDNGCVQAVALLRSLGETP